MLRFIINIRYIFFIILFLFYPKIREGEAADAWFAPLPSIPPCCQIDSVYQFSS
jgi:hypothetical protein